LIKDGRQILAGEEIRRAGMATNIIVFLLVGLALASARIADAQHRIYRVGVLQAGSPDVPELKGLRDGIKEAGYIEGKNLIMDIPATEQSIDQLRSQAKEYIEKKADVMVGIGGTTILIAKELTQEVPLVFPRCCRPCTFRTCEIRRPSGGEYHWRCQSNRC
jgi:putative ABC transport system substrate-binding protein